VTGQINLLIKVQEKAIYRQFSPKMNYFRKKSGEKGEFGGFSLVEATFSIGLLSFGLLSLAPLLALGLKTARVARDDRATAQIAQTLMQQAKQGTLPSGTVYLDIQGDPLASSQTAAYTAQSSSQPMAGNTFLTRLTLRVTPLGALDRTRTYAVVYQAPSPSSP
jgi:uncharacterized protein (TIGR02598 family)